MPKQESKIEHLKRIYAQPNRDLIVERTLSGLRGREIEELKAHVETQRQEIAYWKSMSGSTGEN